MRFIERGEIHEEGLSFLERVVWQLCEWRRVAHSCFLPQSAGLCSAPVHGRYAAGAKRIWNAKKVERRAVPRRRLSLLLLLHLPLLLSPLPSLLHSEWLEGETRRTGEEGEFGLPRLRGQRRRLSGPSPPAFRGCRRPCVCETPEGTVSRHIENHHRWW